MPEGTEEKVAYFEREYHRIIRLRPKRRYFMRQNSIQNKLQMISMEEYLEKRQKIRETERKRDKKTVCRQQELDAAVAMAELYV